MVERGSAIKMVHTITLQTIETTFLHAAVDCE